MGLPAGSLSAGAGAAAVEQIMEVQTEALRRHVLKPLAVDTVLARTGGESDGDSDPWRKVLSGSFVTVDAKGGHLSMLFEPYVSRLGFDLCEQLLSGRVREVVPA